ncbi:MAG TPA: heme-binding protein [Pyrinomonadaceae bacterium]|jgi:uncharacterized protein GlcG (DUF336 family)|nr:heme-binding protein [Pyrinomonadaceae bacterium]
MSLFENEKPTPSANRITLEQASAVITAARKKAEDIGVMMNVAIVDEGGNLAAFVRMRD